MDAYTRFKKQRKRFQELKKLRSQLYMNDIKLKEVAERAGVSTAAVSQFFSGTTNSKNIEQTARAMLAEIEKCTA